MTAALVEPELPPAPVAEQLPLSFLPRDPETAKQIAGIYDGSRLRAQRPDIERVIVEMIAQGQSIRAIKRVCHVHHSTIEAVAKLNGVAIDTSRERACSELRLARQLLAESIVEALMDGRLKPESLGVTLGIVTEKLELLSGHATARIEIERKDGPRTWDEFKEKLRAKMGLVAGESGQMREIEATVVHRLDAPADAPAAPADAPADVESEALQSNGSVGATFGPTVTGIPVPAIEPTRGGASTDDDRRRETPTDTDSGNFAQ